MRLRKFFSCCIALLLCLAISAPAFSAPLTKVRTAWMDEFEAFPIWYAKEKGWDKEAGLDLEILYFTSGMAILNALPSGEWQYAAIGAVPAMMGALRYNTYVIANADEEFLIGIGNDIRVVTESPHHGGHRADGGVLPFSRGERVQNRHPGCEIQDFKIQPGFLIPTFFLGVPNGERFEFIHPRGTDLGQGSGKGRRAYGKAEQQGDTATEKLSEAHTFLLMKKILVNATRAASSEEATSFVSVPGPNSRP